MFAAIANRLVLCLADVEPRAQAYNVAPTDQERCFARPAQEPDKAQGLCPESATACNDGAAVCVAARPFDKARPFH